MVTPPKLKETCTTEVPKEQMDRVGVRGSPEAQNKREIHSGDTVSMIVSPALCSLSRKGY